MKSLQESIFDDNIKKDLGALTILTKHIKEYIDNQHINKKRAGLWDCLMNIINDIKYNEKGNKRSYVTIYDINNMEDDDLYICIDFPATNKNKTSVIILIGKGLCDIVPSFPAMVAIYRDYNRITNICANVYASKTMNYKSLLMNNKFQKFKVNKGEVETFIEDVLNQIGHLI